MDQLMIVSYLYAADGTFHATRHQIDCGVFKNVMRQMLEIDPTRGGRFPGLCILEQSKYASRPGAEARPPKDHSCATKYLAEHEAEAPLQRSLV